MDGKPTAPYVAAKQTFVALIGAEPKPAVTISNMFETAAEWRAKSANQLRKWHLPHPRAVQISRHE